MKKLLFTGLFAALIVACFAQKPYKVVFYNFENIFDTIRNPGDLRRGVYARGAQEVEYAQVHQKDQ